MKTAKGTVVGWDKTSGVIRYIQDVRYHPCDDGVLHPFAGDDYITGSESLKVTEPDIAFDGAAAETTFNDGYIVPEVTKYSGELIYLSNISPILRQPTQNEKITLIISYWPLNNQSK